MKSIGLQPRIGTARGFTLVEVMLSLSLMVIILGCAYACLSAGFAAQKVIEPRADVIQTARVTLGLLTADLRCACTLPGGTDFLGIQRRIEDVQADNLDFATHNYSPKAPEQGDFCEVSYYVDKNPTTGRFSLWRRRNPVIALDPLAGGRREEIATGVRGLQFEYFDGIEWYDSWGELDSQPKRSTSSRYYGNLSGLPEAVRITLLLDEKGGRNKDQDGREQTAPLAFRTVVRLNLAGASSASGSSSGSEPSGGSNPAQPAPMPQ